MAFYTLDQLINLYDGYQRAFKIGGQNLLMIQVENDVFVIENRCPHMDVPLDRASQLPGKKIRCNAHGIEFDLVSGDALGPLAGTLCGLKHYDVIYEGNKVGIEL